MQKFEGTVAAGSLDFKVKENEIFGLIGADGSGKTFIDPVVLVMLLFAG